MKSESSSPPRYHIKRSHRQGGCTMNHCVLRVEEEKKLATVGIEPRTSSERKSLVRRSYVKNAGTHARQKPCAGYSKLFVKHPYHIHIINHHGSTRHWHTSSSHIQASFDW